MKNIFPAPIYIFVFAGRMKNILAEKKKALEP
jgi:hypothetical protein